MKKQNHTESKSNYPCQTYNSMFVERGRSMIEVLGTLAVAGILVVGGVKAYTHAMNQHRANELLNEANKRAVVLAAQIMAGRETLSIGEFKNTTSYGTFSAPSYKKGAKTFTLVLSDVEPKVCRSMKNFVDEDSVLAIEGECVKNSALTLVFNTNLSKGVTAPCNIDPNTCLSHALVEGECVCASAADNTQCTSWTNNECGKGKYCEFGLSQQCDDDAHGTGTCQPISYIGNYKSATVNGHEYTMSMCDNCPNWWSAQSWCKAFGKTMVSLSDLHCTSDGCSDTLWKDLGDALYPSTTWTTDVHQSCYGRYVILAEGGNGGVRGCKRGLLCSDVLCR